MKNLAKLLMVVAIIGLLYGCGDKKKVSPLMKEKITATNLLDLHEKIGNDKDFEIKDIQVFAAAISRLSVKKDTLIGQTVGTVIEWQEDLIKSNSLNNLKSGADFSLMLMNTTNKYEGIKLAKSKEGKEFYQVHFSFTNDLPWDIVGMKGQIKLFLLNQKNQAAPVKPIDFTYPSPIKANSEATVVINYPVNDEDNMSNFIKTYWKNLRGGLLVQQVSFGDMPEKEETK